MMDDGSKEPVEVTGICDAERGEEVTITTTFPQNFNAEEMPWLCFRSSLQDMKIYIDGELREAYTTKDTRLWGKYSVSAYVFVPLEASDNGKTVTASMVTDSKYAGVINSVYYGTVFGMYIQYAKVNTFEVICALFMLVLALMAIWILAESPMRQLYFQNISLAGYMTHFMAYLLAIPIILFMNYVQKQRYSRNVYCRYKTQFDKILPFDYLWLFWIIRRRDTVIRTNYICGGCI